MNSEFELLNDKVQRLVSLAHSLRLENAELRRNSSFLLASNEEMKQRMDQASERVSNLLAQLPNQADVGEDIV